MTVQISHSYSYFKLVARRNLKRKQPHKQNELHESKRSKLYHIKGKEQKQHTYKQSINQTRLPSPQSTEEIYVSRNIYVNGSNHQVLIPEECDIYEGLRLWYPEIYTAVMEEKNEMYIKNTLTEDYIEAVWSHLDYLEWLYD
jgi:hypothetical protein